VSAHAEGKADAEWGFLKNIVNIDTFFGTGAEGSSPNRKSKKMGFKFMQDQMKDIKGEGDKKPEPTPV